MGDILDVSRRKIATMGDDLKVRNLQGVVLGRVEINGTVYDSTGDKAGYFTEDGNIFKGFRKVGRVQNDGNVYDYENQKVGSVVGEHIKLAGATLLLLVR